MAGTAIFLSLLSLLIAMKHGQIMKDLVAVNSWPLVQAVTGNSEDGKPVIKMRVTNVGIGPAIVRNFHVEYRGKRYVSAEAFLEACCGTLPVADNRKG